MKCSTFFAFGVFHLSLCGAAFHGLVAAEKPASPPPVTAPAESTHEHEWAIKIERPGLKNLHRVTDNLYRGAQPTARGMRELEAMGIKTIVNLRAVHLDKNELRNTKLQREHIWFNTWHPEDKDVVRFLEIVADTNRAPVFVHCQHGSDRTGMMMAVYRIALQGWSKDEAIAEMTKGDFGFHSTWQNLVRYLRNLDVEQLKRGARIR